MKTHIKARIDAICGDRPIEGRESIAKAKEYQRLYRSRPEVKERMKHYMKEYRGRDI